MAKIGPEMENLDRKWPIFMKKASIWRYRVEFNKRGAPEAIRTPDPFLRREVLCPAELRAQLV